MIRKEAEYRLAKKRLLTLHRTGCLDGTQSPLR